MSPVTFGWAMLVSLVPQRYRSRSALEGGRRLWEAAALCGFAQVIVFTFIFIALFITDATGFMEQASGLVLNNEKGPEMNVVAVRFTTGAMGLTNFLLRPVPMSLAYMAIEGAGRAFMAVAFGQILPTLPLGMLAAVHSLFGIRKRKAEAAILNSDVIEPARDNTYDWLVLAARQKPEWSPYIGIEFRGELYVLDGEQTEASPRPFGYRLRKNPEGNLMVVVNHYHPD
jgi:hypothetical protein